MQWQFPFTGCRIRKVALIRSYLGQRQVSHSRATATGRKFVTHLERIRNSPQKPLCLILVWRAPFSNCQPCCFLPSSLCSIKKRFIMGGWVKGRHFLEQIQFNRLQIVQFDCIGVRNPFVSFSFGDFPFPIFSPALLPSSLCSINKWFIRRAS